MFVKCLFLFGLFLLPFIFWPNSYVIYEIPKVWFFNRWVEVLLLFTLFKVVSLKTFKFQTIHLLLPIYLGWVVLSAVSGPNLGQSLLGNFYRDDGIVTLIHLAALLFIVSVNFKKTWIKPVFQVLTTNSFILSVTNIYSVIQNFKNTLFFGQANYLAGYQLVALPLTLYLLKTSSNKTTRFLLSGCALLQFISIYLTNSKASVALALSIFLFSHRYAMARLNFKFIFSLLIFISVAYYMFVSIDNLVLDKTSLTKNNYLFEGRGRIYAKALLAVKEKPLFGWGWSNFSIAFDQIIWPVPINHDVYVDKVHSSLLENFVTGGIIGGILYLCVTYLVLKNLRGFNPLLLCGIAFFLHSQTNVISIAEESLFWIFAGVGGSLLTNVDD